MASSLEVPPSLRIVPGFVETKNSTTRLVIPTSVQPAWPPYSRVGETVPSRARQFPAHAHEQEEVLTFVTEGSATYALGEGAAELLRPGSARFLSAPGKAEHRISPARGAPARWFSLVATLPPGIAGSPHLQANEAPTSFRSDEDARVRSLVGGTSSVSSLAGLEAAEITFEEGGTTFRRVGHDRRGLVYVISGRGTVDGKPIETGEAALAEGVAGIALGSVGTLRTIVATAPRSRPASSPPGTPSPS
jgi:redox-sensitive bicupin YhaK (pirin superfamily)